LVHSTCVPGFRAPPLRSEALHSARLVLLYFRGVTAMSAGCSGSLISA
jgi:hypothetical protein